MSIKSVCFSLPWRLLAGLESMVMMTTTTGNSGFALHSGTGLKLILGLDLTTLLEVRSVFLPR
jgi:hypothetical protein